MKRQPIFKSKTALCINIDTSETAEIVKKLKREFKKIILVNNHKDAIAVYKNKLPDLIMIELQVSDGEGIELIKQVRLYDYLIPIIVLSNHAKRGTLMEIANLSVDACLFKPLDAELFTESIHRSIKRNASDDGFIMLQKDLIFNTVTKELHMKGSIVSLGIKEQQLLMFLIKNHSKTITHEEIEKKLWPLDVVSDSTVRKLILRLRKKMAADIIISVRGVGYQLNPKNAKNRASQALSALSFGHNSVL
ncbi:MAG: response regulator transcription factor [Sulfurimonas sp.]